MIIMYLSVYIALKQINPFNLLIQLLNLSKALDMNSGKMRKQ